MAVPYVTRSLGWVKRECVLPREQVRLRHLLRCETDSDSRDREGRNQEDVFPPRLTWRGWYGLRWAAAGWVWVCTTGCIGWIKQEISRPAVAGVRHCLHIDSDRWVIEGKFSLYTVGVQVLALPKVLEAVPVDNLPVLQLELGQVNVDGMGIFREVLEVPGLSGADPGEFSDIFIEMPSVNEHRHRVAGVESVITAFLFVQGEDFRVPDVRSLNQRGNGDQFGG